LTVAGDSLVPGAGATRLRLGPYQGRRHGHGSTVTTHGDRGPARGPGAAAGSE
jgi:hypothetical protein